jgi:hypothetical protein
MLKTIFMRSEPMSAILVKMPPAMRSAEAPSDSPMAKPMKQGARVVSGDEQQDDEHQAELDRDEQHADAHAGLAAGWRSREGLAAQRGEGGARVGEGVHADAEPGHAVAAGDADEAPQHDDQHDGPRVMCDSTPK